jgi:hypothetical protein
MKDGINNMILIQYIWQNVLESDNSNDGWNIASDLLANHTEF